MENKKQTRGKRKFWIFLVIIFGIILFSNNVLGKCYNCLEKGQPYGPAMTCVSEKDKCDMSSGYALNFYYGWDSECRCEKDDYGTPRVIKNNVCKSNAEEIRIGELIIGEQRNMSLCPLCRGTQISTHRAEFPSSTGSDSPSYLIVCEIPPHTPLSKPYYGCLSSERGIPTKCYQCRYLGPGFYSGWLGGNIISMDDQMSPEDTRRSIMYMNACNSQKQCPMHPECPGDTNGDGERDFIDLMKITRRWTRPSDCGIWNGCCDGADLNNDRTIDFKDYAIITAYYKEPCPDK